MAIEFCYFTNKKLVDFVLSTNQNVPEVGQAVVEGFRLLMHGLTSLILQMADERSST
jgi:hypothetical protein